MPDTKPFLPETSNPMEMPQRAPSPTPPADEIIEPWLPLLTVAVTEYSTMANHLMARLMRQFGVEKYAIFTRHFWTWYDEYEDEYLRPERESEGEYDKSDEWSYFRNGNDMSFINTVTGVKVKASIAYALAFGGDFGVLHFSFLMAYLRARAVNRPEFMPLVEFLDKQQASLHRSFETLHDRGVLVAYDTRYARIYALAPTQQPQKAE